MRDSVIPDCFRTASRIGPEYASVIPAAYRLEASVARQRAIGVIPNVRGAETDLRAAEEHHGAR
jgi:hypothetical protein